MTTPMAPQPDPDIDDLGEGALAEAALDAATAPADGEVDPQVADLNLSPDAPGPAGTGEGA